jgi:hypothetical protein
MAVVHAEGAFVWQEYAADNELDQSKGLSSTSWVATRCSKFEGKDTYPDPFKCNDGRDCLKDEPCSDGEPCICNDGKKDKVKHLGFTGNEEVRLTRVYCKQQLTYFISDHFC